MEYKLAHMSDLNYLYRDLEPEYQIEYKQPETLSGIHLLIFSLNSLCSWNLLHRCKL